MNGRPRGRGLGGLGLGGFGLGRHARVRVQRGCHGSGHRLLGFSHDRSRARRKSMQDARKRMIVTVSSSASSGAARAAPALDLQAITQRTQAGAAAGLTNLLMVCAAGPGGLLLGVTGATIPDTLSERHAVSFRRGGANAACAGAMRVPVPGARSAAALDDATRPQREVRCRVFLRGAPRRDSRP
jgi:hypothetical protein